MDLNRKTILIIRPDAIGDVVLMIPMIRELKRVYPSSKIYTLQSEYTADLLSNHPDIETVLIDQSHLPEYRGIRGYLKYAAFFRSFSFDCVIQPYFELYYAALMVLAGIPCRVGDGNKLFLRWLLTHPVSLNFRQLMLHECEQNIHLLSHFGTDFYYHQSISLFYDECHKIQLSDSWPAFSSGHHSYIVIHPTTGGGNKPWAAHSYSELIQYFLAHSDYFIVITGFGSRDASVVNDIIQPIGSHDRVISLVNKTYLNQLKVLLDYASLVIGTDTGPTHMAAAFGTPVLCISTTFFVKPLRWGPWMTPNSVVNHHLGASSVASKKLETHYDSPLGAHHVFDSAIHLIKHADAIDEGDRNQWLKASISLAFFAGDRDTLTDPGWANMIRLALQQGFRCIIWLSSKKDTDYIPPDLFMCDIEVCSPYFVFKARDLVINYDVGCIHLPVQSHKVLWRLISVLAGLTAYVPPLLLYGYHNSEDLVHFYSMKFSNKT